MTALLRVVFIEQTEDRRLFEEAKILLQAHKYRVYEASQPKPRSFKVTLNHCPVYCRKANEDLPNASEILKLVKKETRRQLSEMYVTASKQRLSDFYRLYLGQSPPINKDWNRSSLSRRWSSKRNKQLSQDKCLRLFLKSSSVVPPKVRSLSTYSVPRLTHFQVAHTSKMLCLAK